MPLLGVANLRSARRSNGDSGARQLNELLSHTTAPTIIDHLAKSRLFHTRGMERAFDMRQGRAMTSP